MRFLKINIDKDCMAGVADDHPTSTKDVIL